MKKQEFTKGKAGKIGKIKAKNGAIFANFFANFPDNVSPTTNFFANFSDIVSPSTNFQQILKNMSQCIPFLDTRRQLSDGTYPVRIKVASGSNLYLPTGIYVAEDAWDPVAGRITTPSRKTDNMLLESLVHSVRMRLASLKSTGDWKRLTNAQRKTLLLNTEADIDEVRTQGETLGSFYRKVMATKKSPRTREIYGLTLKKLTEFCDIEKTTLREISKMWVRRFEASLTGMSPNTVNIHLRNLRCVINCALDEELIETYPFRRYDMPREETRKRALSIDKFRRLLALQGLTPGQQEYLDMYLLIFMLMGINMVDLHALTKDNIVDGRIEYRRSKTGRLYSIKIEPEIQELLDRHKGRNHLLLFADRYNNHKDYAKRLNEALSKLGEWEPTPEADRHRGVKTMRMKPIEPQLTAYWARHSWGTYASELDIPFDTISEALGHEHSGSATTRIYVDFNRGKVDEANRRVIDWVLYGKK